MRLLDLFCGAGGAAVGYSQAGFTEIVGVDIVPQPNYPFTFIQGDALEPPVELGGFDLIHASPPCQDYTPMSKRKGGRGRYDRLIIQTLDLVGNRPFVLENVVGSHVDMGGYFIRLHGAMFNLPIVRERLFAASWLIMAPAPTAKVSGDDVIAVYGPPDGRWVNRRVDGSKQFAWSTIKEGQDALDVPWMTDELEVREAIPPAYTKFIGEQFLAQLPLE